MHEYEIWETGKVTIHGLGLPGLPRPSNCKWTGEVSWSGLQKAMKLIFQISALPILRISNVSYDVNVMKNLGLLSASFWEMENY